MAVADLLVPNKDGRETRVNTGSPLPVVLLSSGGVELSIDADTGAVTTASTIHDQVHDGQAFSVDVVTVSGTSLTVAFRTGAKECHMVSGFRAESKVHFDMIEAPTWDTGTGTQIKLYGRNRISSKISSVQEDSTGAFIATEFVLKDPTNLAGGTVLRTLYAWTSVFVGAEVRDVAEFLLRLNTQYAFVLTSDDGAKGLQVVLSWFETG